MTDPRALPRQSVPITDAVVERLTERLCDATMAVIGTLRQEDRQRYIDAMHDRTRRALEEVAEYAAS